MPGEVTLSVSTLIGFVLTLVRVSGVFVFVPLPGVREAMNPVRIALAMGITICLFRQWPHPSADLSIGHFVMWILPEAALGIGIGLSVAFATEALAFGAQLIGTQAGYSFASTVDPQTAADSTVLVVMMQLVGGLLFFTMGLDRDVIALFAHSLEVQPPGSFVLNRSAAEAVLASGSLMLSTGFRLAMPITAVMLMIDISLALVGRLNSQLHLMTVAFPIKMIVGLFILGWLMLLMPNLLRGTFAGTFAASRALVGH